MWKNSLEPYRPQATIIIISIQLEDRFWQEPEPSQATGMALAHCILGSFLGVGCHCFPPPLEFPLSHLGASTCKRHERPLSAKDGIMGEKWPGFFDMPRKSATWETALLPPPRKACCGFFFARKIRRLRPGSNPRSWVPEASMLTTRPTKPLINDRK